jgi:hypothetical protein
MIDENYDPPEGILGRVLRQWELAEKILSGQRLTVKEKRDAYFFITGQNPPPPKSRGRPTEGRRDFKLALQYLKKRKEWKGETSKLRDMLKKEHKMIGSNDVTFYAAINRGIELADSDARDILKNSTDSKERADWMNVLNHIKEYRESAEVKKKRA